MAVWMSGAGGDGVGRDGADTRETIDFATAAAVVPLTRVIYRSRATRPFSTPELHEMVVAAQSRNAAERITGLVVYDRDWFYQWLEGPDAGIARVVESINHDGRHADFAMMAPERAIGRVFSGWDMQLAGRVGAGSAGGVVRPPRHVLAALRGALEDTAVALSELAPRRRPAPRRRETLATRILRDVILSRVVPELAGRFRGPQRVLAMPHRRTTELVQYLAAGDTDSAALLLREALPEAGDLVAMLAWLVEPAAQRLGDLWAADALDEPEVTLGLCCLRAAVRRAVVPVVVRVPEVRATLRVLSAACPGEPHALGTTLHPEAMLQAGWSPRVIAVAKEEALLDAVSSERFDCLDLSTSATVTRADSVPALAATIARVRWASRNPALAVVLGGRGALRVAGRAGADAAVGSSLDVVLAVRTAVALRAA